MKPMPLTRERVALLFASLLLVSAVADARPRNCQPGSFGTGPGKLVVEDRTPTAAFSAVDVANGACVEIVQGDKFNVRVEGEADTLRELDIIVDNGVLHIRDTRQSGFKKFFRATTTGSCAWSSLRHNIKRSLFMAPAMSLPTH